MLEKGIKAPDFTLLDKNGEQVSLSQFLGKKVTPEIIHRDAPNRHALLLRAMMPFGKETLLSLASAKILWHPM